MEWSVAINVRESLDSTIQIAKMLDDAEISRIWIIDFPGPRFAPVIADIIASITSTRIGLGLLSPFIYDVESIVRFTETLVNVHGDRFDLLIGPGDRDALQSIGISKWIPREVVEMTSQSSSDIKENLISRGIKGQVFLAAQGPKMIAESMIADGVILNYSDPDMIEWALKRTGNSREGWHKGIFIPSYLTKNSDNNPPADFIHSAAIVALGSPSRVIKELNLHEIPRARGAYQKAGGRSSKVLKILKDEIMKWGLYSDSKGALDYVSNIGRLGINEVIFGPPMSHSISSIENLLESYKLSKE